MVAESSRAVYLSYASQDGEAARRIYEALRGAGIEVWFDQSELAGDTGDAVIRKQIQECALFMPIISANTQATRQGYYRNEWRLADERTQMGRSATFIVPVCIDDTSNRDADVPDSFTAVPWMRVAGGDVGSLFASRVRRLLSPGPVEEPAPAKAAAAGDPVVDKPGDGAAAFAEAAARRAAEKKQKKARARARWAMAVVVLLLGLAGYFLLPAGEEPEPPPRIASVAVLPFDDFSGGRSQGYLSDGIAESLCAALGSISSLRVPGWTSVVRYKNRQKTLQEIAQDLHVDAIVDGSAQSVRNDMLVTVQLVEAATGRQLWAASYQRDLMDFFDVQRQIARAIASEVGARPTQPEQRRLALAPPINREAVQAYLKGRQLANLRTTESTEAAIEQLERAVQLEPKFAPAHAALAFACLDAADRSMPPADAIARAESAAREAVRRDEELPEAHGALGTVLLYRWEWAQADAEFQDALRLNKRDAINHDGYARYLIARGRVDDAVGHMRQALELEPQSVRFNADFIFILLNARRYADALRQAQETLVLDRDSYQSHAGLGSVRILTGDFKAGIASLSEAQRIDDSPAIRAQLADAHARAGNRKEAELLLAELLTEREREKGEIHIRAGLIAQVYAGLGKADEAFAWLDRAIVEKDPMVIWLPTAWYYDSLRSDLRYAKLLEKLGMAK